MQFRGTRIKPEEQAIDKRRAYLAGQASPARGEATARSRQLRHPGMVCRGSQGQNHPTNKSSTTHVVNECGVKPQDD